MKIKRVFITGGSGFVGTNLIQFLINKGEYEIVVFDELEIDIEKKYRDTITYHKGNILSLSDLQKVFENRSFDIVIHLASAMPNKAVLDEKLWDINVNGTKNIASVASRNKVKSFIFTSTNVAYGVPLTLPVTEEMPLLPLEMYGRSKAQAEKELEKFKEEMSIQIFRCPVISGVGRLGLNAILFEFISENKNLYVLGDGSNKYQFIDVIDVASALEKASNASGFDIYTIGADEVLTLKELYQKVIEYAKSSSKIVSLPKTPALFILSILDKLNISPLGVYQYTMIGRSIYADTTKIKKKLGWHPKKTNLDTFIENYDWYIKNKGKFEEIGTGSHSSNRSLPKMGIFKLLKLIS